MQSPSLNPTELIWTKHFWKECCHFILLQTLFLIHCCRVLFSSLMGNLSTCTFIRYERGVPACGSDHQNVGGSALLLQKLLTSILWYLLSQVTLLVLTFSVFSFCAELLLLLRVSLQWLSREFRLGLVPAWGAANMQVRGREKHFIPFFSGRYALSTCLWMYHRISMWVRCLLTAQSFFSPAVR